MRVYVRLWLCGVCVGSVTCAVRVCLVLATLCCLLDCACCLLPAPFVLLGRTPSLCRLTSQRDADAAASQEALAAANSQVGGWAVIPAFAPLGCGVNR